jgi:hypothetical protein
MYLVHKVAIKNQKFKPAEDSFLALKFEAVCYRLFFEGVSDIAAS